MVDYCKQLGMKCNPYCTYFPNMECREFKFDSEGVKRRAVKIPEFICGYDGHCIKSWYDECPMEIDKLKFLKEKQNGKSKRL